MDKLYFLFFILFPFSIGYSQPASPFIKADSNLIYYGNANTKFYYITNDTFFFTNKNDVIKFTDSTQSQLPLDLDKIDFSKGKLLLLPYHGVDCHSKFKFSTSLDSISKSFTVNTDIIYGGCRAGGHYYTSWFLIPKLSEDYKIVFTSHIIDEK
jgi:hypothetical protein